MRVRRLFRRALGWLGGLLLGGGVAAWAIPLSERMLVVATQELVTPVASGGSGVVLARSVEGVVAMAWMDAGAAGRGAVRFAWWNQTAGHWGEASTVAPGTWDRLPPEMAPVLALGTGGLIAVAWPEQAGATSGAWRTTGSRDGGKTWQRWEVLPARIDQALAVALAVLADGRVLAAWAEVGGPVRARLLGEPSKSPVWELGRRAEPQLSLAPLLDGGALLGSAGGFDRTPPRPGVRAFDGAGWLTEAGVAVEAPGSAGSGALRLVADGPKVRALWFSPAKEEPQVWLATSVDAGGRWTMAQRTDLGRPSGPVALALSRDGSSYALWSEAAGDDMSLPGGLYLRRINALGGAMQPTCLALPKALAGPVQMVVAREDSPQGAAQLLVAWRKAKGAVVSQLVTLPPAAELAEMDADCACNEGQEVAAGYAVRGQVVAVDGERASLRIQQAGVFGLMRAGELSVHVAPVVAQQINPATQFLARLEKRGGEWWLLDVRVLGRP